MAVDYLHISLWAQTLAVCANGQVLDYYAISTAANGAGEQRNSGCTPCGRHRVRIKIGEACPIGTVFRGRRSTGEIYSPELAACYPKRDWILTRILWLTGLESGRNRGGEVDTLRRFIYIHGCPESAPLGVAQSHGCIRMHSHDLIAVFNAVTAGTLVDIQMAPFGARMSDC